MNNDDNCIYILTNKLNTVLYTGVTNNLLRRIQEHKDADDKDFAHRYRAYKLVYFECGGDTMAAINREKQIKGGSRKNKERLINSINPDWRDLAEDFFPE